MEEKGGERNEREEVGHFSEGYAESDEDVKRGYGDGEGNERYYHRIEAEA